MTVPLPSAFLVDILDVAAAAELWRVGAWDVHAWSSCNRETSSGILLPELAAGSVWIDEFLGSFKYDAATVALLRSRDALAQVDERFWDFLCGREFTGTWKHIQTDGDRFIGGPVVLIEGPVGEILLYRTGVCEIVSYCVSVASEADEITRPVPSNVMILDGGSATSVGHGWSLLAASSLMTAGRKPNWQPKIVLSSGDPQQALQEVEAHIKRTQPSDDEHL